jgi:hypothetical protein
MAFYRSMSSLPQYKEDKEQLIKQRKLVEKWSRVPEIGSGLQAMEDRSSRKLALMLEQQARHMTKLSEMQYSSSFATTPENMIRLVRIVYPNSILDRAFTSFPLETAKDSVKYLKPVFSSNPNIHRSFDAGAFGSDKILYESTEDRFPTEMANGTVTAGPPVTVSFTTDEFTLGYTPGYAMLYDSNKRAIAVENRNLTWSVMAGIDLTITYVGAGVYHVTGANAGDVAYAVGRYNSEADINGDYLGSLQFILEDFQFKIRQISMGISWTQVAELTLDSSTGVSTEEIMFESAAQHIKAAMDYRAAKLAYAIATTNGMAPVTFDAEAGATTKDSYTQTAQTVTQAIERVGDVMYNTIARGGVSRIIGGPKAVTYLRLNAGFTTRNAQPRIGAYQVGELYDIPVFKVPSNVIPDNELLCIWKNDNNDADVFLAFGTLIPFASTGTLQRKNFYKEAGVSYYGDYHCFNNKYANRIIINNIRG